MLSFRQELTRGTNFVTAVGGEPSLMLGRLKKLYDNFFLSTATNGLRKIPYRGLRKSRYRCFGLG